MKYILMVGDGMADYPLEEFGGKTILEQAHTPNLDYLASVGQMGRVKTIPDGMEPGSDVAILSVLGYDPRCYYTGRAPLEAKFLGINPGPDEIAFRCNLVSIHNYTLIDYSAGQIRNEEAREIIGFLNSHLADSDKRFYPGLSYRNLFILKGDFDKTVCVPPHDIIGQRIEPHLPKGDGGSYIGSIMYSTYDLLKNHPNNIQRRERGENPANMAWLWGQGKTPDLVSFAERFGLKGKVVAAVHLVKGIGLYAGLEVLEVVGATGGLDTDYRAKGLAAVKALEDSDFVFVHVEAPDEAGHLGDIEAKKRAIEEFDEKVVGVILKGLADFGEYRLLVLSDHPTPVRLRTHTSDYVPFVIYDSREPMYNENSFSEAAALNTPLCIDDGSKLMDLFIRRL